MQTLLCFLITLAALLYVTWLACGSPKLVHVLEHDDLRFGKLGLILLRDPFAGKIDELELVLGITLAGQSGWSSLLSDAAWEPTLYWWRVNFRLYGLFRMRTVWGFKQKLNGMDVHGPVGRKFGMPWERFRWETAHGATPLESRVSTPETPEASHVDSCTSLHGGFICDCGAHAPGAVYDYENPMTDHIERTLSNHRRDHDGQDPSAIRLPHEQLTQLKHEGPHKLTRIITPSGEAWAYGGIPLQAM